MTVRLTGYASDPDGDEIAFRWEAGAGTLDPHDGRGQSVSWTAPGEPGTYRVWLKVSDGIDESAKSIDIEVGPRIPTLFMSLDLDRTDYPYFLVGDAHLEVGARSTMRVGPGVTVIVNSSSSGLLVEGELIVEGTAEERVTFKPNYCPGSPTFWDGITFTGEAASGTLQYLNLPLAEIALKVDWEASVAGVGLSISGSRDKAVVVANAGRLVLEDSKIWDNNHGVMVENGVLEISGSSVRYNGNYGLYLVSSGYDAFFQASVSACIVATNNGDGLRLSQYADPVINGNSIFQNRTQAGTGFGLILWSYSGDRTIDARGNFWGVGDSGTPEEQEALILEQIYQANTLAGVDYSGWLTSPPVSD